MTEQADILKAIEANNKAMTDYRELMESRVKALEAGGAARAAELEASAKKAFDKVDELTKQIEKMEAKATNRPRNGGSRKGEESEGDIEYKEGFDSYARRGIETGLRDLEKKNTTTVAVSADGGYALPKVIADDIEAMVVDVSPIRELATVRQVSTTDFHKLVNLHGTASGWVGETAARPATNTSQFADVVPPMGEIYANPQVSQQALEDLFFNVDAWLAEEVSIEFARAEGAAFCTGDGTAKPKGIFSYTTAATADASRAFGTIEHVATGVSAGFPASNPTDILITLLGKLKQAYRKRASWLTNKAALFQIAAMKDSGGRYVFNPISAPGLPPTILNYPVTEAEDVPAIAASSLSVAVGDFKRAYLIVDRVGMSTLRDPFTNKPYVGFYTRKRLGGGLVNSESLKLLKFI